MIQNIKWRKYKYVNPQIPGHVAQGLSNFEIAEVGGYTVMTAVCKGGRLFSFASPQDRRRFNPEIGIHKMLSRAHLKQYTRNNPTLDLIFFLNLAKDANNVDFKVPRKLLKTLA